MLDWRTLFQAEKYWSRKKEVDKKEDVEEEGETMEGRGGRKGERGLVWGLLLMLMLGGQGQGWSEEDNISHGSRMWNWRC